MPQSDKSSSDKSSSDKPGPEKPNIVLIVTDQHRADHLGCYGNGIVRTPHIDSIAARGLAFDRFYVASPICMPNRATIMTGKMPSAHGVPTNGLPLPLESTTFVDLLRNAGYRTALVGKCHLQNMTPIPVEDWNYPPPPPGRKPPPELAESYRRAVDGPGYEVERTELFIADPDRVVETPYYGFDDLRLVTRHGDATQGHYTRWLLQRTNDPDALRGRANALDPAGITAPQAWRTRMPEDLYSTSYIRDAASDLLAEYAQTPDRPFFMQFSFPDPHHPFTPPGRYWDMYDPNDIPVPASLDAEHVDPSALWRKFHRDLEDGVAKREHVHPYALSAREAQESIALTYGMITMIDDAIGAFLARLDELGLAENTVLIFTADHGDMMGDHGLMLETRLRIREPDPRAVHLERAGRRRGGRRRRAERPAVGLDRYRRDGARPGRPGAAQRQPRVRPHGGGRRRRAGARRPPGRGGGPPGQFECRPLPAPAHAGDRTLAPDLLGGRSAGRTVRPRGGSAGSAQPVERSGLAGHQGRTPRTHAARNPAPPGHGPESGLVRVSGAGLYPPRVSSIWRRIAEHSGLRRSM